jgi:hypothetical protein
MQARTAVGEGGAGEVQRKMVTHLDERTVTPNGGGKANPFPAEGKANSFQFNCGKEVRRRAKALIERNRGTWHELDNDKLIASATSELDCSVRRYSAPVNNIEWARVDAELYWQRNLLELEALTHINDMEAAEQATVMLKPATPMPISAEERYRAMQETMEVAVVGGQMVPTMLNHERACYSTRPAACRGSNNTLLTTPSVPMLIWQARELAIAMSASLDMDTATVQGDVKRYETGVIPFPAVQFGASPLWEACVSGYELEEGSKHSRYSMHTPMFGDASIVNASAFSLDGSAIDRIMSWHPHAALIANGARFGFGLMSDGAVRVQEGLNPEFKDEEIEQITAWIEKQRDSGRAVPMSAEEAAALTGLFVSPTAVAPKPGAPGQIRVCHNLSAGGANSVNAGIDFDPINPIGLLQLDSFVARIQYMMDLHPGKKIVVSKADMKEFFRQIPVRRRDMARLTQRWKGIVYAHEAFTFGARSAPHVCSAVTNALCDEMARRGFFCQCFIDDCVILAYEDEIEDAVVALRHLIGQFGLVENLVKFVPASQQVAIVGVHFDLEKFTVGITPEKRTSTLELLTAVVRTNVTTVGELRSLAGKLAFLSAVVPFARCYTSFIWKAAGDSMRSARESVHVNTNVLRAVQWWVEVLKGRRFTVTDMTLGTLRNPLSITSAVTSDACKLGFAGVAIVHKLWMQDIWQAGEVVDKAQINVRECFGTLCWLAALAETGVLSCTVVVFETDNECTVWGGNKGHSHKHVLNFLVVAMHVLQEHYRFLLILKHIPGVLNVLSDRLSRQWPASRLQLSAESGWRRLTIPTSVRALLKVALSAGLSGAVLDVSDLNGVSPKCSLQSFVLSTMISPSRTTSSLSIPWIPYRDCVALTPTA